MTDRNQEHADKVVDEILDCFNELNRLESDLTILQRNVDRAMGHLSQALLHNGEVKKQLDPESYKLDRVYDADDPDDAQKMREEEEREATRGK